MNTTLQQQITPNKVVKTSFMQKKTSLEDKLVHYPWLVDAELCRKSFYNFVQEFWYVICAEEPVWNWHIEYLCNELQQIAERVIRREPKKYDLIINIPPGTTKTTICTIMYPVWVWTRDPSIKFITSSYSANLALPHSDKSRDILRSDKYQLFYPEVKVRPDSDLKSNYINTAKGARFSTSVGGTVTGMHGHIIIVDDPLNPTQAVSNLERAAANDWLDNTLSTRKVDKDISVLVLIMQRLHINDCTAHVMDKGTAVRHICLPGTTDNIINIKPKELAKKYIDEMLDPIRLSRDTCNNMRKELGEYNYLAQVEQDPKPKEGAMFKIDRFNVIPGFNPSDVIRSVRYWDKAGTQGAGAYTAGVLMHFMKTGRFVVANVVRGQWAAPAREARIKLVADSDGSNVKVIVEQEPGSGGKESAENTIKSLAGFAVAKDRVTGSKAVRAEPYSVQVENNNVDVVRASWTNEFINEHEIYPLGKYKDQVDAAAGALNALVGNIKSAGTWRIG